MVMAPVVSVVMAAVVSVAVAAVVGWMYVAMEGVSIAAETIICFQPAVSKFIASEVCLLQQVVQNIQNDTLMLIFSAEGLHDSVQ